MLRNTQTHCGGIRLQGKKTTSYQEQDPQKVAVYQEEIKDIPPKKISYVDESGIAATQMGSRILAPFQYNGTIDSRLFKFWLSSQLLLSLEPEAVIVIDNRFVPFHEAVTSCYPKCRM